MIGASSSLACRSALASTSRTTKKCGTLVQLCVVFSAMSRAVVLNEGPMAAVAGLACVFCKAAVTSDARISPPGPDPRKLERCTPCSAARRRAFGDILVCREGTAAVGAEEAVDADSLATLFRAPWVGSTSDGTSSPEFKIQAMVLPTGTSLPGCALIPARMPSPGDSTSRTALSVSTSSSGSPLLTASPSFFSHETNFPVSCAISSAGITTLIGIQLTRSLEVMNIFDV